MQGVIHDCLKWIFMNKLTETQWLKMLALAKADGYADFMNQKKYDDELTIRLIVSTAKALEISLNDCLDLYGKLFYHYAMDKGYGKMLHHLGRDMESFLQNLDFHHLFLTSFVYGSLKSPSFRVEKISSNNLRLYYYSKRQGLYPLAMGLVRECGKEIYGCDLRLEVIDRIEEDLTEQFGFIRYETVIDIFDETPDIKNGHNIKFAPHQLTRVNDENVEDGLLSFVQSDLVDLHPFHVMFNKCLRITSIGKFLQRHLPFIKYGDLVTLRFTITHPSLKWDIAEIAKFGNSHVFLAVKTRNSVDDYKLELKGSPKISTLDDLHKQQMSISDMPVYDVTRELILLNQQRTVEVELSKQLESTTVQLHQVSKDLESEKKRIQDILEEMLPKSVAEDLKMGRPVGAKSFDVASILFSDIVTFTVISSRTDPANIVVMLNDMFTRFDDLCATNDVYKVETIGDAYMVSGGVPEEDTLHAVKVARQACAMITAASSVCEPGTDKPLQIRVGVHSGPVMAGVVGRKMPRYCLFGDTVNTASRMESHGAPGQIHVSHTFRRCLLQEGSNEFLMVKRGVTNIKGKGDMLTYFLTRDTGSNGVSPAPTLPNHRGGLKESLFPTLAGKARSSICSIS